jgi:DNA-binding NarL/FixJ family response regulator
MKGVEGISRFRASFPKTKVIIVSGQIGSNEIGSSLAQGADGYIPKTIGGMGMIGAIQLVMAGEKYLPSIYLESMQAKRSGPQDSTRDIPADSPLAKLTPREWDILNKLVEGNPNKQIGRALGLEEITVKIHLCNVYRKLGVANRAQAVRVALQCGIEDMMKATV